MELDRIWLRPWSDGDGHPSSEYHVLEGRPFRAGRRRIGIVSPYYPWPLSHGGAVRIFHLLREGAKDFDLVLFAFSSGLEAGPNPVLNFVSRVYLFELPRYRKPRWSTWLPPEVCEYESSVLRKLLLETRRELDLSLIQLEYTQLGNYSGDLLVEHDVTFDLFEQVATREPSLSNRWNAFRWRAFEEKAVRRFRSVITMAARDSGLLPWAVARVIPNGVDLNRFEPSEEEPGENVLFIGSFRHHPNIVAFRFFCDEVWPLVRERNPGATFTAVAGPDPELYWRSCTGDPFPQGREGVTLLGFVADVVPLYRHSNLVVAPTLVSAGTNLKVLEAMAMQRAVVATSCGCQGLDLEHGVSVWVADEPAAIAEGVCSLLASRSERRRLALAAAKVAEQFDWAAIGRRQRQVWEEFIGS